VENIEGDDADSDKKGNTVRVTKILENTYVAYKRISFAVLFTKSGIYSTVDKLVALNDQAALVCASGENISVIGRG
jgi:hypothetical protein